MITITPEHDEEIKRLRLMELLSWREISLAILGSSSGHAKIAIRRRARELGLPMRITTAKQYDAAKRGADTRMRNPITRARWLRAINEKKRSRPASAAAL